LARVLIVGCGCRGRELASALAADGHAVRGTTRDADARAAIEQSGAEPALADPDRLETLLPHLSGVSVMCWLLGTATGGEEDVAALHGPRLASIAAKLVDSHVRGLVYEAGGSVPASVLAEGAATVRRLGAANRVPVEVVDADPDDPGAWTAAMRAAVERVLA
jgi:uncharacterized protein YbjT (DUF2867 family)